MTQHHKNEDREYEKSGLYPKDGKPFRIVALVMSLVAVTAVLAVAAAILNMILL